MTLLFPGSTPSPVSFQQIALPVRAVQW